MMWKEAIDDAINKTRANINRVGLAPDDYLIWGDYFYLEALLRLEKGIKGFGYERKGGHSN